MVRKPFIISLLVLILITPAISFAQEGLAINIGDGQIFDDGNLITSG
jgi:hypothetical protein